jgi:hypothetical protein
VRPRDLLIPPVRSRTATAATEHGSSLILNPGCAAESATRAARPWCRSRGGILALLRPIKPSKPLPSKSNVLGSGTFETGTPAKPFGRTRSQGANSTGLRLAERGAPVASPPPPVATSYRYCRFPGGSIALCCRLHHAMLSPPIRHAVTSEASNQP